MRNVVLSLSKFSRRPQSSSPERPGVSVEPFPPAYSQWLFSDDMADACVFLLNLPEDEFTP
jgi:hypothetical protein